MTNFYPMHGRSKMVKEGMRTRDGHVIEWSAHLLEPRTLNIYSRPEPRIIHRDPATSGAALPSNLRFRDSPTWRLPVSFDRQRWWVTSANAYVPPSDPKAPTFAWNPLLPLSKQWSAIRTTSALVVDLLDDWTIHHAFHGVRSELEVGYSRLFERADHVFANAEGTLALAHRFGRSDAHLLLNGCDPERFSARSRAAGPLTVGYVGKIGRRVDLPLVLEAVRTLPHFRFVFVGPLLDGPLDSALMQAPNFEHRGDAHYRDVPAILEEFDLGWIPHQVGEGEVGGDVIKAYEYRAAGLPVLSTPIAGQRERALPGVTVLDRVEHVDYLEGYSGLERIPREPFRIPRELTWRFKAQAMLRSAGLVE
ncbi:hypothetical protein O1W71_11910 [Microbacterium sp. H37-C3]|uniref:hypothetical protein n=1 Tax=Microbacterium sp. H37-C3 TaxID=3004354 RepID=UPI0022B02855|nr:hypothetical protein [Microbacterium sp. H37-C3]MCZ4068375.1 hypothetical protein [Microbacterium sp. H37-C3]